MTAANEAEAQGRTGSWIRYLPLAVLIVLSAAAAFASYRYNFLSLEKIVAYRDRLQGFVHAYGPMAVIAYSASYVTIVALSIPGGVFMTILGGFLFGWLFGGAIASVSATLGAVLVFLIARTSVGDILVRKAGPRLQKFAEGFREDAFSYLLFLRFLPIMPFWMTNLAPALFGVRLETFAFATMIGILPATFTFATAGAGLDSVIAAQKASFSACKASGRVDCAFDLDVWSLLTPQILAAFAALGVMALIPVVVRHWRRRAAKVPVVGPSTARPEHPNA
ncbi:MAG TPA: VTT domain-containing protein [Beijerinckiaceae bacterium]